MASWDMGDGEVIGHRGKEVESAGRLGGLIRRKRRKKKDWAGQLGGGHSTLKG
jgi:hypothetical protein